MSVRNTLFTRYSQFYWFRMLTDSLLFMIILLGSNFVNNGLSLLAEIGGAFLLGAFSALAAPNQRSKAPQPNLLIKK